MKEIALIIHEDVTLSTVTGAMDMLIHTNRLFQQLYKHQPFKIVLACEKPIDDPMLIQASLVSYSTIAEVTHPDLIIVPAFYGDRDVMLKKHEGIIKWISAMHKNGAEIA